MTARGIRNNNPGNIRHGIDWLGDEPEGTRTDADFEHFETMGYGIRAMIVLLKTYRSKYGADTVREIISRWAPSSENDTTAYINAVCSGWVTPDEVLPDSRDTYLFLCQRIARHENGPDYALIKPEDWSEGLRLAGYDMPSPTVNPPKETPKEEKKMALPAIAWAAASELLPFVVDLFRGHGGSTATRNADIIEKVGQPILDIAKTVTGAPNDQAAVEAIKDDPAKVQEFREAVALDLDKLVGILERVTKMEDDSRDRAAERAKGDATDILMPLMDRGFQALSAAFIAEFALLMVGFIMKMDIQVLMVVLTLFVATCTKLVDRWGQLYDYRVGSSSGSQMKDAIIAASKK